MINSRVQYIPSSLYLLFTPLAETVSRLNTITYQGKYSEFLERHFLFESQKRLDSFKEGVIISPEEFASFHVDERLHFKGRKHGSDTKLPCKVQVLGERRGRQERYVRHHDEVVLASTAYPFVRFFLLINQPVALAHHVDAFLRLKVDVGPELLDVQLIRPISQVIVHVGVIEDVDLEVQFDGRIFP